MPLPLFTTDAGESEEDGETCGGGEDSFNTQSDEREREEVQGRVAIKGTDVVGRKGGRDGRKPHARWRSGRNNGEESLVASVTSAIAVATSPSEEHEDALTMDHTTISPSSSYADLKSLEEFAGRQSTADTGAAGVADAALDALVGESAGASLAIVGSGIVKVNGRGMSRTYHRKVAGSNGTTTTAEVVNYVTSIPRTIAAVAASVKRQRRRMRSRRASDSCAATAVCTDAVNESSETETDSDNSPQLVRVVEHHHTVRSNKKDFPPRRKFSLWWAAVVIPTILTLPFVIVIVSVLFYPVVLTLIGLAYGLTWILYLKYAQTDLPDTVVRRPYLPINPVRVFQVDMVVLRNAFELTAGPFGLAMYNWIKYKVNTPRRKFGRLEERVFRSISYDIEPDSGAGARPWRKLDVYIPVFLKDRRGNVIGVKHRRNVEARLDEGYPGSPPIGGPPTTAGVRTEPPIVPVIIYIFGGAWISGSKGMFSPMAQTMSDDGYVTVIPNYTLYPHGKIHDMVDDVRACINWTYKNISKYRGNPEKIYIMGHGSGAHVAALTVIHDSVIAAGVAASMRWNEDGGETLGGQSSEMLKARINGDGSAAPSPQQVCGLILFAGVFDLTYQYAYEVKRGIEEISGMARCVGRSPDRLVMASPSVLLARAVRSRRDRQVVWQMLPKNWLLVHGDKDNISPAQHSRSLFEVLCKASGGMATGRDSGQGDVRLKMYNNIHHLNPAIGLLAPNTRLCTALLSDIRSVC